MNGVGYGGINLDYQVGISALPPISSKGGRAEDAVPSPTANDLTHSPERTGSGRFQVGGPGSIQVH